MRFARELMPDFVEIFYTYPFPGTELHRIAVQEGLLKEGEIPLEAYSRPAISGLYMTREELADWRRRALRRIGELASRMIEAGPDRRGAGASGAGLR